MNYEHVLGFALEHPWALTDGMRAIIADILARRIAGVETPQAELDALVNRKNLPQPVRGGVAIIPFYGVVAPRMNLLSEMSGGTTFDGLSAALREAMANDAVTTIVFDVDSPGGNVAGASEFAAEVRTARATKPIIAQVNHLMASASYWPLANATKIVATRSSMVGAIGVYHLHNDISESLAKMGIKRTVISAGKFKAEGADGGPLSKEALDHIKALAEGAYSRFVDDVAKGRGVKVSDVRNGFGEGRAVDADTALALGMIDDIDTLAGTLAKVLPKAPTGRASASATDPALAASQEPTPDALWQNDIERALLELDL